MSKWLSDDIPAFAVVGRANAGKTATLATLLEVDDDAVLRVSPTPGETTGVHLLPVKYDGRELIRFFDTPGFQQPVEAMREIEKLAAGKVPGPAEIAKFVAQHGERFPDEARLLEPLLEGAGILYVVDPSKPLRDSFLAEIEILRWTGRPRLALLNPQGGLEGGGREHEEAWRSRLGTAFNLVRTFDAHGARYEERRRLLEALLQIEERQAPRIRQVLEAMENERGSRRDEVAEAILDFLEHALMLRVTEPLDEREKTIQSKRERKQQQLGEKYQQQISKLEKQCVEKMLKTYRHHLLKADVDPERHRGLDLATAETWRKWGLNRTQLTAAGTMAGAAAGALIDAGTLGHTVGLAALIGGLGGGAAAFFKGGSLPELRVKIGGGLNLGTGDGTAMTVGPPGSANFPWILLDSMLLRFGGILSRSHGRRDEEMLAVGEGDGFTRSFPAERRGLMQKWFNSCLKGSPDRGREPEVFSALTDSLEEIERDKFSN